MDKEGYYPLFEIDLAEFGEALGGLEGNSIISYAKLPGGHEEYQVVGVSLEEGLGAGQRGLPLLAVERIRLAGMNI